jgi:hypothetical protein
MDMDIIWIEDSIAIRPTEDSCLRYRRHYFGHHRHRYFLFFLLTSSMKATAAVLARNHRRSFPPYLSPLGFDFRRETTGGVSRHIFLHWILIFGAKALRGSYPEAGLSRHFLQTEEKMAGK